jgi:hypothetical protein
MRIRLFSGPRSFLLLLVFVAIHQRIFASSQIAQQPISKTDAAQQQDLDRPLPDIPALMREVETHQQTSEEIRKDYIFHAIETREDEDKNGTVKKSGSNEYDAFWIDGVPVRKLVRKNGRELTPDEQKKESERIDKDIAKAREKKGKADEKGKDTDSRGNQMLTASRILELGSFTNPRRVKINGRDTIVVDYAGNPKARTRNHFEDVVRDLVGTVWVDEQDKVLVKTEGHFLNPFKIGAGLVVNIRKETSFGMEQKKINDEVWLPERLEGHGEIRFLLVVNFSGAINVQMSDYRKFKATSTILPGMSTVEIEPAPK